MCDYPGSSKDFFGEGYTTSGGFRWVLDGGDIGSRHGRIMGGGAESWGWGRIMGGEGGGGGGIMLGRGGFMSFLDPKRQYKIHILRRRKSLGRNINSNKKSLTVT